MHRARFRQPLPADPFSDNPQAAHKASIAQVLLQLGAVAAALTPAPLQKPDEWVQHGLARRMLPQRRLPELKPTPDGFALRPELGSDAGDAHAKGVQSRRLLKPRLPARM